MNQKKIAVIGAGAMGLAAAYELVKNGYRVEVYEADSTPGGMAAHFDFEGLSLERFYHFICRTDQPLFDLLEELDLSHALVWRDTSMGFYYANELHTWGDPISLFAFPHLTPIQKLRYGLHAFTSTKRTNWDRLDTITAKDWLSDWLGDAAYDVCWRKLLELKFFEYSDQISAAWIWNRIKRVGSSRRNLFHEQLGYISGGSETLIERLVSCIEGNGGKVRLGSRVGKIIFENGRCKGLLLEDDHRREYDAVISTVAIPYATQMLSDLPSNLLDGYKRLKNIAVVCVVHKLRRSVTPHFWLNINDSRFDVPGIVEFSNLRDMGEESVVYIPYYMPQTHEKYSWSDNEFISETQKYLKFLNPAIQAADFLASRVGRLRYAQPVCEPGFVDLLPPITPMPGLQVADTSFYYPEDRGISESIRLGRKMASAISVGETA